MLHGRHQKNIREGVNLLRSNGPTTALRLIARLDLNRGRDARRKGLSAANSGRTGEAGTSGQRQESSDCSRRQIPRLPES
jgi:hypothetical protein